MRVQDSQAPHGSSRGPCGPVPPPASPGAVQRSRQDLGHGGLAGAPGADEQVRVVHAVLLDRVGERADDVLLAHDVCERARAMTAVQRSGHGLSESSGEVGRLGLRAAIMIPLGALVAWALVGAGFLELRHRLQPAVGRRRGASAPAGLRCPRRAHPAPAGDAAGRDPDAVRGLRPDALGDHRVPVAGRAGVGHVRARGALVRPGGRRGGGNRDPDPHPGPELRRAGLRRHPVRRAGARGDPGRGARPRPAPAARPARPRRAAQTRGVAVLARLRGVQARPAAAAARGLRPGDLDGARPRPGRRPAALPARHARQRGGAGAHDRPGRRPGHRPAPARRDPARAGAARRGRGRPARAGLHAPARGAADRGRLRLDRRLLRARRRRPADPRPLPAAPRRAARGVLRRGRLRLAACCRATTRGAPAGR